MGATASADAGRTEIRPFTIDVPEEQLTDLRRRIVATKWPDQEPDASQGVRLETIQALADYRATGYDWRRFEERFAALPPSSPRSTAWTSTSSTSAPPTRMPCRSSSRTGGRARRSSS